MQKKLLSTTALVAAAGMLAPVAISEANAAEPMSVSVGGYLQTGIQVQDEDDGPGEGGANRQDITIPTDGEIQFTAKTTLDNGIEVGARIEYEAHNQGGGSSIVDERYVWFEGDFGRLIVGSNEAVTSPMHYQAPVGAAVFGVNTPTFGFASPQGGGNHASTTTYSFIAGDAGHVIYFSPRMSGFQLGLSYAPDATQSAVDSQSTPADNDGLEDEFAVAVNFTNSFDGVDVAASVGYNQASQEVDTATNDDEYAINGGLVIGFSGFSVGASIKHTNNGIDSNGDTLTWDAGVTYSTGPWTVGFTYLKSETEDTGGDDELDAFAVTGTYNLGPGVDLWAGVKYYDWQDDVSNPADENEAIIGMVGTSVSF